MENLDIVLQEICDSSLRGYVHSEQSADEQEAIIIRIKELRDSLNPMQKQLLNQLLVMATIRMKHLSRGYLWV